MTGDRPTSDSASGAGIVPRAWLVAGSWPDGALADDAPQGAVAAALVCTAVSAISTLMSWTVPQLAQALALPPGEVAAVVAGEALPTVEFLARIRRATGIAVWPSAEVIAARRLSSPG